MQQWRSTQVGATSSTVEESSAVTARLELIRECSALNDEGILLDGRVFGRVLEHKCLKEVLVAFPKYLVTLSELSLKFMRHVMRDEGGLYMVWLKKCESSRNWRRTALQAVLMEP